MKIKSGYKAIVATVVMGLAGGNALGQLPGLPAAKPIEAGAARPGDVRPVPVAPTGPVRGSLFKAGVAGPAQAGYGAEGASAAPMSMIAVAAPLPKRYRKNDVLTVVIREDSDSQINGQSTSKKEQDYDFALEQFLKLALSASGVPALGTDSNGLPEVKFKFSNDRKTDASQERSDSFSARITATVVDVKPNGTMVIEAVKQIVIDKEVQTFKLSGVCRVEDVGIGNTILSTQLANLSLSKQTTGEVRDGNKRGWLNQWLDTWSPF